MTEERLNEIKSLMKSEGFNAVVLTVVKDKQETTHTSQNGFYVGGSYLTSYPGFYGNFYNYYSQPYAFGPYYNSFGEYIPTGSSTYVETNYVLETLAYNIDEPSENQLVAVVTTNLNDPKEAHKTAQKYVDKIMSHLEKK